MMTVAADGKSSGANLTAQLDSAALDDRSWTHSRTPTQQQRLRLLRFGAASATYGIGVLLLGACVALGQLEWLRFLAIAVGFLLINLVFLLLFLSRINLRFKDPSLTFAQVLVASSTVPLILLSSPHLDPVAVPFYSVLFVFAMLRLDRSSLFKVGAYIVTTYAIAVALRLRWYATSISLSNEAVTALLVIACTCWFAYAAGCISRLRLRLKETAAQLESLATFDGLTGVFNRRQIEVMLTREVRRAQRCAEPLAILLADLDHFKDINDRFGHAVGDEVLRQAAAVIRSTLRADAEVGRWGGEEFLVVLPNTSPQAAGTCAQRVCEELATTAFDVGDRLVVTASIGIAIWSGAEPLAALVSRADRAMYAAKAAGRNRVECLEPPTWLERSPAVVAAPLCQTGSARQS